MELSVVLPAYDEAHRLDETLERILAHLSARGSSFEILVVDDGSRDGTAAVVEAFAGRGVRLLRHQRNRGKGAALQTGVAASTGDWVLLCDADLATPIEELDSLRRAAGEAEVVVGSRAHPDARIERRQPFPREAMGRIFNRWLRLLGLTDLRDTQCGFKLLRGDLARELFAAMQVSRFAWDVELLLAARRRGCRVAEVGVRWRHGAGSKVHPVADSLRMLRDTLRLWWNGRPRRPRGLWELAAVTILLAWYGGSALRHGAHASPTYDEPAHLVAGFATGRWNDYRVSPEHPPLARRIAALPLLWVDPWPWDPTDADAAPRRAARSWRRAAAHWAAMNPDHEQHWGFSHTLLYGMESRSLRRLGAAGTREVDPSAALTADDFLWDSHRLVALGRAALLPLGLALVLLVWSWARALFGPVPALVPLAAASFDPNLIAHGSLVTTDMAATLGLLATFYFLRRALQGGRWQDVLCIVLAVVFAVCSKHTGLVALPLAAVTGLAAALAGRSDPGAPSLRLQLGRLATCLLAGSLAVPVGVWASHGFRFSAVARGEAVLPLEDTLYRSAATRQLLVRFPEGPPAEEVARAVGRTPLGLGERAIALAHDRRLLPQAYLFGLAKARLHSILRHSYLRGAESATGFRTYFLWTFALKTPLAILLLLVAALVLLWARPPPRRAELVWLAVPAGLLWLLAFGSGLNIGHRHVLPVYPFLLVLLGHVGASVRSPARRRGLAVAAVLAIALSSTMVFAPWSRPQLVPPHQLAFFNELAGGPVGGVRNLGDSNLDWGQGLRALARWLEQRGIEGPIGLAYFGTADPRAYGIRHVKLPGGYIFEPPFEPVDFPEPAPAWVAVSVSVFQQERLRRRFEGFLAGAELVDTVGHVLRVYRMPGAKPGPGAP